MVHAVGVLGPNGMVGSAVVKYLIAHHKLGQVKLVLLHRPGGPPKNIPGDVDLECRQIDLDGDPASLEGAVQGLNVFVSVIAPQALLLEVKLAEALAKSQDLVYFIPSLFGRPWRPEERSQPQKQKLAQFIFAGRERALELGTEVTTVECGYFDYSMFRDSLLGVNLKDNTFQLSSKQLEHRLPITSTDYLGAAIAALVVLPPKDVAGKTFSAVQFNPSGREIIEVLMKINSGQPTKISDFTETDLEHLRNDSQGFGVAVAGYRENWELDEWDFGPPIEVQGRPVEELSDVMRSYQ